jgi:hypothetical protein
MSLVGGLAETGCCGSSSASREGGWQTGKGERKHRLYGILRGRHVSHVTVQNGFEPVRTRSRNVDWARTENRTVGSVRVQPCAGNRTLGSVPIGSGSNRSSELNFNIARSGVEVVIGCRARDEISESLQVDFSWRRGKDDVYDGHGCG